MTLSDDDGATEKVPKWGQTPNGHFLERGGHGAD